MSLTRYLPVLSLVAASATLLFVAFSRIGYPFELEWMESMSLRTVQWIDLGRTIYSAPSMEFVAYPYTPLFFYTSYLVTLVIGPGFDAMRTVSLVSSLISFWFLYRLLARKLAHDAALFGTALYVAAYSLNGFWFDIARVDALFMSLSIIGIYFFSKETLRSFLVAAVLFALATFTKQTALLIAAPLCLYAVYKHRTRGLWLGIPLGVLVIGVAVMIDAATDGWFLYYTFGFMRNQLYKTGYVPHLLWHDLAKPLPILFLMTLLGSWLLYKKRVRLPDTSLLMVIFACIAAALYVDSHQASFKNDLMPMYLGLSVLFAVLLNSLVEVFPDKRRWQATVACLQVLMLLPPSFSQLPTDADLQAGLKLRERFSNGDSIWVPSQGYNFDEQRISRYSHLLPASDMIYLDETDHKEIYIKDLQARLPLIDTLILEGMTGFGPEKAVPIDNKVTGPIIRKDFVLVDSLFTIGDESFYPVTGEQRRPQYIYIRR